MITLVAMKIATHPFMLLCQILRQGLMIAGYRCLCTLLLETQISNFVVDLLNLFFVSHMVLLGGSLSFALLFKLLAFPMLAI